MHIEAANFTKFVKKYLPLFFKNKIVLDVGGGDINGNNRYLFENCDLTVNDVCGGPNVNIICRTKDLPFEKETYDTIISTECFEHDPEYRESFLKIYELLKPGGLFLFTCASTGRREHGTIKTTPYDSLGTISCQEDMMNYYYNLTEDDIYKIMDPSKIFKQWRFHYNPYSYDLYFYGIKKDDTDMLYDIPEYDDNCISK